MAGRRPDYILYAVRKDQDNEKSKDKTKVGAGWVTQYDGISIRLGPCVTLTDRDDVWLILSPNDFKDKDRERKNDPDVDPA